MLHFIRKHSTKLVAGAAGAVVVGLAVYEFLSRSIGGQASTEEADHAERPEEVSPQSPDQSPSQSVTEEEEPESWGVSHSYATKCHSASV